MHQHRGYKYNPNPNPNPPSYQTDDIVYILSDTNPPVRAHVLDIPVDNDEEPYTLQREDNGDIVQCLAQNISKTNPIP